jgi:hypothetical protein
VAPRRLPTLALGRDLDALARHDMSWLHRSCPSNFVLPSHGDIGYIPPSDDTATYPTVTWDRPQRARRDDERRDPLGVIHSDSFTRRH